MCAFAREAPADSPFAAAPSQHTSGLGVLELLPGIGPLVQLGARAGDLFAGLFDHTDGKPGNGKPAALGAADAGKLLDKQYLYGDDIQVDPSAPMGNLDAESKAQRLAALSKLNQVNPEDPKSDQYCGPAALLAAAVYAKGGKGVDMIIDQLEAGGEKDASDPLEVLRRSADRGTLDVGQMQELQAQLFASMHAKMLADPKISAEDKASPGINGKTMQDYIRDNPAMAKMFKDNDMAVSFIDSTGDEKVDHYVLGLNDPSRAAGGNADGGYNTFYDPFARKGGQVVTDGGEVNAYSSTAHRDYR